MFGEIRVLIGAVIVGIICSLNFGFVGYKYGKTKGYELGAKDALDGKLKYVQTIQSDSIIIKK